MKEELMKSLLKRAKGYRYNEVQEEYSAKEDGQFVLTKKKIVKKYCPPDSSALRAYLDMTSERGASDMSDEELEREKVELIEKIKEDIKKEESKNSASKKSTDK